VPTETITLDLSDGAPHYVDLLDGEGTAGAWDLRAEGWNLFLNGGESGPGKAGGIDMELLDLEMQFDELNRKNQMLYFFFYDSYACAVSDWWWYGLDGTHTLFSNYHVYIVRRGDRELALQMLDYYRVIDGSAEAGYPEFRWADLADGEVLVDDVDATAGGLGAATDDPANKWTYFSFDDGVVELTDEESLTSDAWDLGFKRFNIKSNSGPSGDAGVVTLDFDIARGEEAADVLGFTREGEAPRFDARLDDWATEGSDAFEEDTIRPVLRRWVMEDALDEDRWFLVSDRTGELVAKIRVLDLDVGAGSGVDAGPASLTLEWAVLE